MEIKIKDKYFYWSTIVDAPITKGMSLEEFRKRYIEECRRSGHKNQFNKTIKTLEKCSVSNGIGWNAYNTLEDAIIPNRAGDNEKSISIEEIYEKYTGDEK